MITDRLPKKVRTVELTSWRSRTDLYGEPTLMFIELMDEEEELQIGDKVTFDLRVVIERKNSNQNGKK